MMIDESDRIAKYRFYSSDEVLASSGNDDDDFEEIPSFVRPPKRGSLRRTVSVPTSFKERKRQHRRNKTSPASTKQRPFRAVCNDIPPGERKRKWKSPESRYPEQHDLNRWAYARRDEYNRYLIPRTSSTELFRAVEEKSVLEDDGVVLRGLAFVDEVTD